MSLDNGEVFDSEVRIHEGEKAEILKSRGFQTFVSDLETKFALLTFDSIPCSRLFYLLSLSQNIDKLKFKRVFSLMKMTRFSFETNFQCKLIFKSITN